MLPLALSLAFCHSVAGRGERWRTSWCCIQPRTADAAAVRGACCASLPVSFVPTASSSLPSSHTPAPVNVAVAAFVPAHRLHILHSRQCRHDSLPFHLTQLPPSSDPACEPTSLRDILQVSKHPRDADRPAPARATAAAPAAAVARPHPPTPPYPSAAQPIQEPLRIPAQRARQQRSIRLPFDFSTAHKRCCLE